MKVFRIKSWHFIFLFIVLIIIVKIAESFCELPVSNDMSLNRLPPDLLESTIQTGTYGILISDMNYNSKSDRLMSQRLDKLSKSGKYSTKFYVIDINDKELCNKGIYISGTPTILLFRNGLEDKRIMGEVSESNLKMIIERLEKH